MENYNVGVMMRGKREALGYTRREVCRICHGEFTEKTLCRLESGKGRVRRESIKALLELYHQHFHTVDMSLELESSSAGRLYNEILLLIFQKNYQDAERKRELLEQYVSKQSRTSLCYLEMLKRLLQYCMKGEEIDGEETVRFFEKQLEEMLPAGADLEKWPMNRTELNTWLIFLNILSAEKQYERIISLARKLLANIEREYQPRRIFADLHGCFTYKLIRALHKMGKTEEICELAEKSIKICEEVGNISKIYQLKSELLYYWEKNDFFQDEKLKEQCFETAKKMYSLSAVCGDKGGSNYFKRYLKRVYNYIDLYY